MKKILSIIIAATMIAGALTGCGGGNASAAAGDTAANNGGEGISIVTTIFPEYDWVMNVLGDNPAGAEVTMLLDNGVDIHSYQPTAEDIMKISTCDVFIYVGGESDEWMDDALKESVNGNMKVINLLEALGDKVREEEIVEGMEHEHELEEAEYDEHVWLSLRNSAELVNVIADTVSSVDPDNASVYKDNASGYTAKLKDLDAQYESAVSSGAYDTVLFGDRFPFRYMTDDYGLKYYAAFAGCSAETEASFETVTFLSGKVDELGLKSVLTIESTDKKIAETIISNTASKDQKILTLDSMQSVTSKDVAAGATYLGIMQSNLEVLKEALN